MRIKVVCLVSHSPRPEGPWLTASRPTRSRGLISVIGNHLRVSQTHATRHLHRSRTTNTKWYPLHSTLRPKIGNQGTQLIFNAYSPRRLAREHRRSLSYKINHSMSQTQNPKTWTYIHTNQLRSDTSAGPWHTVLRRQAFRPTDLSVRSQCRCIPAFSFKTPSSPCQITNFQTHPDP